MKVKTAELTGAALDWAVAKCEGVTPTEWEFQCALDGTYDYSTDWSQGGPIIERERLILRPNFNGGWECTANSQVWQVDPTPLIAAMRCYVAATLGNEVDIPELIFSP